ncbi:MAG: glutathione peroxidase [Gammaproteobacteria bacterium]
MTHLYDFEVDLNNGEKLNLSDLKGKKVLLVNTASKCGLTPQYTGLQELSAELRDKLTVIGFPCNQFGEQEPGADDEIASFCDLNYGVDFPLSKKIDVNGDDAAPLFKYVTGALPGFFGSTRVKWNFTKFLFDENGEPVKRFGPRDKPEAIARYL